MTGLDDHIAATPLIDHHVHGAFTVDLDRAGFEQHLNEGSPAAVPPWMTQFDSQLGFAVRRWCAPVLDLPAHAPADEYWAHRTELGTAEVTRRFLRAAGVSDWLVDTGYGAGSLLDPDGMAAVSGGRAREVVRLESLAEELEYDSGRDYADAFTALLAERTQDAVAVKSILAYRTGFDLDLTPPAPAAVSNAAQRWLDEGRPRLADKALIRFGLHAAVARGLPLQLHTGIGDRDLDLRRVNPLHLVDFLRSVPDVPILLLHCYPFHREAGYLAQAFPNVHFDVGLAITQSGVRSAAVVAESFELAPFAKQLYASDAWGLPELHYLGALLWRRAVAAAFGHWVGEGDWSRADARRVVTMIARDNARRVYRL